MRSMARLPRLLYPKGCESVVTGQGGSSKAGGVFGGAGSTDAAEGVVERAEVVGLPWSVWCGLGHWCVSMAGLSSRFSTGGGVLLSRAKEWVRVSGGRVALSRAAPWPFFGEVFRSMREEMGRGIMSVGRVGDTSHRKAWTRYLGLQRD